MEGRDLSSSSTSEAAGTTSSPTNNPDRSSSVDADDAVFKISFALAKDAALHFQSGRFAECLEVLSRILQMKPDDPKVLHNIAIAEYFRDGCPDPKNLLDLLSRVKKKSDELACATSEQLEPNGNAGNEVILGSKGSNTSDHHISTNGATRIYSYEFDSSLATLNIAIIWFHLHEHAKTLSVLEPLYQYIDPIKESTALHICLLLLDAALACFDAAKSADILAYMKKAFGVGCVSQGESGITQQQGANLIAKSSSVCSNSPATDVSSSELAAGGNASESSLSRTLSEEALDYEAILLDIGGQNLTRSTGVPTNELSRAPIDKSLSANELKLKLQLYKIQFLLLARNLKLAKREIKLTMNISRGRDSSRVLLLKSQLEYARGNHHKAIKLLMASNNHIDDCSSIRKNFQQEFLSIFSNNLGCIYYQLGKYQTSSILFSKALDNCSSIRKEKRQTLSTFSQDSSLLILYNCGLQYLACGKPVLAARCFQRSGLFFCKRPLFWLRLAECCLMALEKGLIKSNTGASGVRVHVVGKGKWRHLLVEDGNRRNGFMDSLQTDSYGMSDEGQLKLSVPFARQCLFNALHLLNSSGSGHSNSGLPSNTSSAENESRKLSCSNIFNHKNFHNVDPKASSVSVGLGQVSSNGDAKEQKGGMSLELLQNSLSWYEDTCRRENHLIKQAVLANLAYLELESDNPNEALCFAKSLLEFPECSPVYIFLSRLYSAEALCLLRRPKEAAEYLSEYVCGVGAVKLPYRQEDCEKWWVDKTGESEELDGAVTRKDSSTLEGQGVMFLKPEEAQATIFANFAVVAAMQGDFDQADSMITRALSISPTNPETTLMAIYVDLMLDKPHEAVQKLKCYGRCIYLPSAITRNKS